MPHPVHVPTEPWSVLTHARQSNVPVQVLESHGENRDALSYACLLSDGSYGLVGVSNLRDHAMFSLGAPLEPGTSRTQALSQHQELFGTWAERHGLPTPSPAEHPCEMDAGADLHFFDKWAAARPGLSKGTPVYVVQRFAAGALLNQFPVPELHDACLQALHADLTINRAKGAVSTRSKAEVEALILVLALVCDEYQDGFQEVRTLLSDGPDIKQRVADVLRACADSASLEAMQLAIDRAFRDARTSQEREVYGGSMGAAYHGALPVRFPLARFVAHGLQNCL